MSIAALHPEIELLPGMIWLSRRQFELLYWRLPGPTRLLLAAFMFQPAGKLLSQLQPETTAAAQCAIKPWSFPRATARAASGSDKSNDEANPWSDR